MTHNTKVSQYVILRVNLSGYAKSEGFIGYFESREIGKKDCIAAAISHFFSFFQQQAEACVLVTSTASRAFDVLSEYKHETDLLGNWVNRLEESDEYIDANFDSFEVNLKEWENIFRICSLRMRALLHGHQFFVWLNEGLIFYPHEDEGYGVIATKERGRKIGRLFLENVKADGRFVVDIRAY